MYTQPTSSASEPIVVNLSPPEVKVAAGGQPAEIIAEVKNAGSTVDQYSIEIENLDPSWYTITVQSVSLFPGDSAPIPIRIHPPKGKDTRAGHHAFVVKARSHADPMLMGKTKGVVQVGSYAVFHMELAPARFTGRKGKYRLKMANGGNSELQLELEPKDAESNLKYGIKKSDPTIDPGATLVMPITVKPTGFHLVGEGQRYKFNIVGRPVDGALEDAKEVTGELIHKPLFASWKVPLIVLAALLAVGLFFTFGRNVSALCERGTRQTVGYFLYNGPLNFIWSLACENTRYTGPGPEQTPIPGQAPVTEDSCTSGPGFKEVRAKYKDKVGDCIEHEWYEQGRQVSHQKTKNGQLTFFLLCDRPNQNDATKCAGNLVPQIYFYGTDGKTYTFVNCAPGKFEDCEMKEVEQLR